MTLPVGASVQLEYDEEADTLYVRLSELRANRSESKWDEGVVFDYHDDQLVGIEVLDVLS